MPNPHPALPMTGEEWGRNEHLESAELWKIPDGRGPEDVAIDSQGNVYAGLEDGRIVRCSDDGRDFETLARLEEGGRPLGVALESDDSLIVCDSGLGRLLRFDIPARRVDVLAAELGGRRLGFVNNPAIAPDGTIYFSESCRRWRQAQVRRAELELTPDGAVHAYDPRRATLSTVCNELVFANGVEVAEDGSYLLVAETFRYSISKVWLSGPKAGLREVLVENLPGFPDNLSAAAGDRFWVALPVPRMALVDFLMPRERVRRAIAPLASWLPVREPHFGWVAEFDAQGNLLRQLQSPSGKCWYLTGVREHGGWLYLGSLHMDAIARVRISPTQTLPAKRGGE